MASLVALTLLVAVAAALPALAGAQDAGMRPDTRLQMETTRKRLVVRPDPQVATAFRDAERATDQLAARRLAEEAAAMPVPPAPQLDHDVTRAIQARNLQRAQRR